MQQTLRQISSFFKFIEPCNVYCDLCNSNFVLHKTNNPSRAIRHTKSLMHKKNEKKIFNHNQESTHIENDIFLSKENENLKQINQNYDIEINQDKDFFQRISTSSLSSDSMMSCKLKAESNFLEAKIKIKINKKKVMEKLTKKFPHIKKNINKKTNFGCLNRKSNKKSNKLFQECKKDSFIEEQNKTQESDNAILRQEIRDSNIKLDLSNKEREEKFKVLMKKILKEFQQYLTLRGVAESTVKTYQSSLRQILSKKFPAEITQSIYEQFLYEAKSFSSRNRRNIIFSYLTDKYHLDLKIINLKKPKLCAKPLKFNKEKIDLTMEKIFEKDKQTFMDCYFLYVTGLRIEEARKFELANYEKQIYHDVLRQKGNQANSIFLGKFFLNIAAKFQWRKIYRHQSTLNKKYKEFCVHLSNKSFRHIYIYIKRICSIKQ